MEKIPQKRKFCLEEADDSPSSKDFQVKDTDSTVNSVSEIVVSKKVKKMGKKDVR